MKRLVLAVALLCALATPSHARQRHYGGLPWCGIYLSQHLGKHDRRLWIAREWAREGHDAGGPGEGVVVVWPHHVGLIVGRYSNGQWLVHSGNDGGRVRTRPRSIAGAIAFRRV